MRVGIHEILTPHKLQKHERARPACPEVAD